MKVKTFGKTAALGLGATALVLAAVSPAQADPDPLPGDSGYTLPALAIAGSDTTQDVMQGFAEEHPMLIESWNASPDVHGLIWPKELLNDDGDPIEVTRPNGSTQGRQALRRSLNGDVQTPWATNPVPLDSGVFDAARSSSAPRPEELDVDGELVYIPFAVDSVQYAAHVTSSAPTSPALTTAQLEDLYSDGETVYQGATIEATEIVGGSLQVGDITLYAPQSGSGTRAFWLDEMGLDEDDPLPEWVFDEYDPGTGLPVRSGGEIVQEHDGSVLAADASSTGTGNAIVPFSASQWTAQQNTSETGVIDRRNGSLLHGAAITRDVYNIVSYAETQVGEPNPSDVHDAFVGPNSELCDDDGDDIVELFGFGVHSNCGAVLDSNRVELEPEE